MVGDSAPIAGRPVMPRRSRVGAVPRRHSHAGVSIEWLVVGFTAAALLALGTVSPELLNAWHVHYISAGGGFYEKIHPATYLTSAALLLLLFRGGDAVGEVDRMISNSKLLMVYFFACVLLTFQCVVLKRPFSNVLDTFMLPAMLSLIIWSLTPNQRKPMVFVIHLVVWINILIGFYEYFSKHRLVPITLGKLVVTDWRSTALLGHPLTAAGVVAMYIMALILVPRLRPRSLWVLPALFVAVCSLMVFGGRTALVSVIVVFAGSALVQCVRLVFGQRVGLPAVILAICSIMLVAAAIPVLFSSGTFDNMITRFASDNGSAHARIASLRLLHLFDWKELMLGTSPTRSGSFQTMMGLDYGIENFWIACIVQYGIIQTVLLTLGLACLFVEVLRRSSAGARVAVLFICIVAASSVSFSSKNITLALYVASIVLLLPREQADQSVRSRSGVRRRFAGAAAMPAR